MTNGAARSRSSARRSRAAAVGQPVTPPPETAAALGSAVSPGSAVPPGRAGSLESAGPAESALAELAARRDALQQAAGLPGAQLKPLLDAAFAELDGAIDALSERQASAAARRAEAPAEPVRAERRMLRAVFQEAPVPLFLLERDGTVRRINNRASDIIGSPPAYAAGKPFTLFVDLPSRAAVQTYLAAAARTGQARQTECALLSEDGVVHARLTVEPISLPEDIGVLLVAASADRSPAPQTPAPQTAAPESAAAGTAAPRAAAPATAAPQASAPGAPKPAPPRAAQPAPPRAAREPDAARAVQTMARRMDLLTSVTRLLLENSTFSESLTLQRCARLLASEFASWVVVDVVRGRRLRRQFAVGPSGGESESIARAARAADPEPDSLPWQVHQSGKSLLQARSDDTGMLGTAPDGVPLVLKLGATSVLSVPIADREHGYGVITLCRQASEGPFQIADLALAEELGTQLAVAIRVDRLFRRRSEVAEALQASLLPRVLPDVPGIELAAAYMGATEGLDVGGDFYDVYPIPGGWGLAIGDVAGKGQEAASLTAAARYAIRVIAHWEPDPVSVLAKANDVLVSEQSGGRFVTAKTAHMAWRGSSLHVSLGTAGHPGPAVIRSDGRVEMLGGGGLPLGLFPVAQPGLEEVDLGQGDLLFFYTDGLTETRSPDMRYYEERLPDELVTLAGRSAAEVVAGVQARAEAFSAGGMRDDLTVLALRGTDPPG
jgi:PAS domain S-box-containing protein